MILSLLQGNIWNYVYKYIYLEFHVISFFMHFSYVGIETFDENS